jgi:hypothetical protein
MAEFEKAHRAIDELLTHFNQRENEPTEKDFISYRYLKCQIEYLYNLMIKD